MRKLILTAVGLVAWSVALFLQGDPVMGEACGHG